MKIRPGGRYLDGTAGRGGHARAIADKLGDTGRLLALDVDSEAVECNRRWAEGAGSRVRVVQENFRKMDRVLKSEGWASVDGILLDCGVSSVQLDQSVRGLSYRGGGELDMRLDDRQGRRLSDFLRELSQEALAGVIREYGEERFSGRVARVIKETYRAGRIRNAQDLADAIVGAVPRGYERGRIHPATRTFQALRILVNDELGALKEALQKGPSLLSAGGRMAVIAFHSLEDRAVKNAFRDLKKAGAGKVLTPKPITAGEEEVRANPRARSAKLRVFERKTSE